MKKLMVFLITLTSMFCAASDSVQAQFLKKIMNTVKGTTENRANDKAAQSTSKAIDQAEQPSQNSSSEGYGDTASTNKVLSAFAKAAAQNLNDTSAADITMKALGNLTGGGGVSAADSAAAIKAYMAANGGSGTYYEYTVVSTTREHGTIQSTSKLYFTNNGEGRSEMNLAAMMGAKNGTPLIVIGKIIQPHYSVVIDNENKEYSLNIIDTSLTNMVHQKCQVTKIGNETVNGFNCIHAKLVSTTGSGMFKSTSTEDIWTSADVPGYATFKKATIQQNITPAMTKALNDAGCGGFFVKMTSVDKHYSMTMQLTKAEKETFPASLFKIPSGYKESNENMMYHLMSSAKK
ncbi:MAG: DUF4412 domain-containing protein [Ginsengibacter sp.]